MKDEGASDILATTLLIALAVVISSAFAMVVRAQLVPTPRYAADVGMAMEPGADGAWATGDELLLVTHRGGEPLPREALSLMLSTPFGSAQHAPLANGALSDGRLSVGEEWRIAATIPASGRVAAHLVVSSEGGSYVLDQIERQGVA